MSYSFQADRKLIKMGLNFWLSTLLALFAIFAAVSSQTEPEIRRKFCIRRLTDHAAFFGNNSCLDDKLMKVIGNCSQKATGKDDFNQGIAQLVTEHCEENKNFRKFEMCIGTSKQGELIQMKLMECLKDVKKCVPWVEKTFPNRLACLDEKTRSVFVECLKTGSGKSELKDVMLLWAQGYCSSLTREPQIDMTAINKIYSCAEKKQISKKLVECI